VRKSKKTLGNLIELSMVSLIVLTLLILAVLTITGCGAGGGGGGGGSVGPITSTGSVQGIVTDDRYRAAVAGVLVQVVGQSLQTTTSGTGFYRIDNIPAGNQVLYFSKSGYVPTSLSITVVANTVTTYDLPDFAPSRPQVDGINPTSAPVQSAITINGFGFGTSQGTVTFAGTPAGGIITWSNTQIKAIVPYTAQTGLVRVIAGGVSSTENVVLTIIPPPHIDSVNPTNGPTGTRVTVTGSDFGSDIGSTHSVAVAKHDGTIISWSNTQITFLVPADAPIGNDDVTVSNLAGTSNGVNFEVTGPLSYSFDLKRIGLDGPKNMTYSSVTTNIYLAQHGDGTAIAVFDTSGNRLSDIDNPSSYAASAVGSDQAGNLYVVTNAWRELYKMNSDGSNATLIATTTYDGKDVAAEYGNYVVVLETSNGIDGWVEIFNHDGVRQYSPWQIAGANTPRSIALCLDGSTVVIADTDNHRILRYNIQGTLLGTYGSQGSTDGKFYYPECIEVGSDGRIYVGDSGNYRFQVFDPFFTFLTKFGTQGSGGGQFWDMTGIATDQNGNVYTVDFAYNNIQKFIQNP